MRAVTDTGEIALFGKRRNIELALILIACTLGLGGYALIHVNIDGVLPANLLPLTLIWLGLGILANIAMRRKAPYADPVFLPIVFALNGIGLAMIHRIDIGWTEPTDAARNQLIWTVLGIALFVGVLFLLRDYQMLSRFPYLLFLTGLGLLLLPIVPGLGIELNGSRIWIMIAGFTFQPAEIAKVVLTMAFASYLASRREVLKLAGIRIGNFTMPRLVDLLPIGIMWAASVLVLIFQRDLGTSLLFFGLFVMMLYVSTEQVRWVLLGVVSFLGAALVISKMASHVQVRIDGWLDPFANFDQNYQIIQSQFGMAWGGLFGRGWGNGRPGLTPIASSDFISSSLGEELGVVGLFAVVMLYLIFVMRGLRTALSARDSFGKLLVSGLSFTLGLQIFAIIGGVIRLLPLTGLTSPFLSQGGSSLVANWIIVGILCVISNQSREPRENPAQLEPVVDMTDDATQVIGVAK